VRVKGQAPIAAAVYELDFTSGSVWIVGKRRIALFFTGCKHAGEKLAEVLKQRASGRDEGSPKDSSIFRRNALYMIDDYVIEGVFAGTQGQSDGFERAEDRVRLDGWVSGRKNAAIARPFCPSD